MQRWFRALPQITRNFKSVAFFDGNDEMVNSVLKIKPMLQKADSNPYEIIFEKIPEVFSNNRDYEIAIRGLGATKLFLEQYLEKMIGRAEKITINTFDKKAQQDLYHTLYEWYEKQSLMSKCGLYGNKATSFMNYISQLKIYDSSEIVKKIIKILTESYVENWNDSSFETYIIELSNVKTEIESIKDEGINLSGKKELIFIDSNGNKVTRYYDTASESTGNILRNLVESALDDFSDLSVNDKTAILIEMIEKILK